MARRSFRRRIRRGFQSAYGRTRTVVQRVYSRSRRPRNNSFLSKNKKVLAVGLLVAVGWYFRDKIKAIFNK